MNSELMALELRRGRWRRARESLHRLDPSAEDFAKGGLARFVEDPSVRLLILPFSRPTQACQKPTSLRQGSVAEAYLVEYFLMPHIFSSDINYRPVKD